jgi:hypothetical protein
MRPRLRHEPASRCPLTTDCWLGPLARSCALAVRFSDAFPFQPVADGLPNLFALGDTLVGFDLFQPVGFSLIDPECVAAFRRHRDSQLYGTCSYLSITGTVNLDLRLSCSRSPSPTRTGLRRYLPTRCRAQAGSRAPQAPGGAERRGASGRGRARRHPLGASEAGHDRC